MTLKIHWTIEHYMSDHPTSASASVAGKQIPQVSIGMPVYNGEKCIREALDSLLAQTFTYFELIISDNASTDGTAAICREYCEKDGRLRYFRQYENIGAAANFQFVLDSARSEIFMWAAHDDKWSKNYILNATNILADTSIGFVFPSFELRSTQLYIGKKFDMSIFGFVESYDKRQRVLNFLALHHDSHKCNIVYSLFRTKLLNLAVKMQGISNDGALGAVVLSLGRGKIINEACFSKRYPKLWPGALSFIYTRFYNVHSNKFDLAKGAALVELSALFPEYVDEVKSIFNCYKPYSHNKNYRICEIKYECEEMKSLMNIMEKVLSVGMPVFNGEKFIREALDSLLAQTFTDFELIISDNASTDGTEAICREYASKDGRIRYVRQAENLGSVANFKYVLDEAVGEYFMWAAADDVWDKNWVETLLPVSVSGQCLAFGIVQTIDGNGNHMQHPANRRKFNYTGSRLVRRLKYYSEPSFLGKANPIYGIYPKNLVANDVFNVLEEDAEGVDMLFLYRLLADADIRGGAAVFLYKRIHDDCAGGGVMRASKNKNYLAVVPKILVNVTHYQWLQILNYGKQSSPFERVAQIVLSPVLLIVNLFYVVVKNPRFSSQ